MKKAVITGATSGIGVAVIEECIRRGASVVAIARKNSGNLLRLPGSPYIDKIELSLDEFSEYEPDVHDADVFYHFAWADTDREGRENPERQRKNIGYTLDAVRLASRFGCKKFIGAGSQAEYGLADTPLAPDTPARPVTAYGVSKYAAGRLAGMLCRQMHISFVWARILSVYGRHDGSGTLIRYVIDCYGKNTRPLLTEGGQIWDYLSADDAGRALYLLGESEAQGVYTLGSGEGRPLREYIRAIYDIMKPEAPLVFGEKPYAKDQVMFLRADISKLTRDTGFRPEVSFEDGIKRMIADA